MKPHNSLIESLGLWLSGTPPAYVSEYPSARNTRIALGYALLIAPALGFAGMYVTLMALALPENFCLWGGVGLAIAIGLLDRAVFMSLSKGSGWLGLGFRVIAASLINVVVSHSLVLYLFSGEIDRDLRAQKAAELTAAYNEGQGRIAQLREPILKAQVQIKSQIEAIRKQQDDLLALRTQTGSELAGWREKLDEELQGKRQSGVVGYGPQAKRLEFLFIKPLEEKLADLNSQAGVLQNQNKLLSDQYRQAVYEADTNPKIVTENAALDKRLQAINEAQNGDILSRTRALHQIIAQEPDLLAIYIIILGALLSLDLAAVVVKATVKHDAVDDQKEMEGVRAKIDLEITRKNYPAFAESRQAIHASATNAIEEVRLLKMEALDKVVKLNELIRDTGAEIVAGVGYLKKIDSQTPKSPKADRFKENVLRRLLEGVDRALDTFFDRTFQGKVSVAPARGMEGSEHGYLVPQQAAIDSFNHELNGNHLHPLPEENQR